MSKRDRLGRGLGALLGEYLGDDVPDTARARPIPVARITPNPFQPRREFAEAELAELADSIRQNGLLQPIVVRPAPEAEVGGAPRWQLVAGERRWRAVLRLGWPEIPAVVREVDDRTLLVLALVENLQRAALGPLEEAEGYRQLVERFGLSQQEVAAVVGRDRSTVANALRLLQLPEPVRRLLEEGRLSAGHARALLGAGSERRVIELAERAVAEGWSVREVEARVKRLRGGAGAGGGRVAGPGSGVQRAVQDAGHRALESELQRVFGTAVRIRLLRGKVKGRIEIPFYDPEDFERIYERLAGKPAVEVVS